MVPSFRSVLTHKSGEARRTTSSVNTTHGWRPYIVRQRRTPDGDDDFVDSAPSKGTTATDELATATIQVQASGEALVVPGGGPSAATTPEPEGESEKNEA